MRIVCWKWKQRQIVRENTKNINYNLKKPDVRVDDENEAREHVLMQTNYQDIIKVNDEISNVSMSSPDIVEGDQDEYALPETKRETTKGELLGVSRI